MSEPRKNHLSIDGGQIKEDENVASYKPIPDSDAEFRNTSKPTLSKSKEKISDEAEEKLLDKEEEAKIVTRVDMADAKYVVGDHRNGDAKIELDANKRQFSGLTKEELLKYADDPFWVRLRWFMFVLFWALWLAMLAGAIAIIIRAPKCAAPVPRAWYEKGPLVDASTLDTYDELESELPALKGANVPGIFSDVTPTYEVLDSEDVVTKFKEFVAKAKEYGVRVIVDLTPNFVSTAHTWFQLSVNRTAPYDTYFTWAKGRDYVETDSGSVPNPPNNWVSTMNTSAWEWNEARKEFYLHQYGSDQPDLNFHNPDVVKEFDKVLRVLMKAGAAGVRLHKVRQMLVNQSLPDELMAIGRGSSPGADHLNYAYWRHKYTADQPALLTLLQQWAELVDSTAAVNPGAGETVFTVAEESGGKWTDELTLRPRAAAAFRLRTGRDLNALVKEMQTPLQRWPAVQLTSDSESADAELAELALLLPAVPVLSVTQLPAATNNTATGEGLSQMVALREDASIEHGQFSVAAVPSRQSSKQLLACARWKPGHTGYVAVYNPWDEEQRANVTLMASVPRALTVYHVSNTVKEYTNYTTNYAVSSDNILVPPKSSVVLSYVPKTVEEQ
ncbi:unnamed protein product [Diatraea saccharalis]|uniref:alpha-glucosidase n=1 Tax=Diatraea saccharalis TaxID=40085 RepID=A0A9N9WE07_9NEOP|nr:unnamed protein product [Diatraea saccharalis]